MAAFKPGRLRRTLTPITGDRGLLTVATANYTVNDDDVHSVSIARGNTSGRNTGYHPTTAEISITGRRDSYDTGEHLRVLLQTGAAEALAAHLGISDYNQIRPRFMGRAGKIGIEDAGGNKFTSTVSGSGWLTQMHYSPHTFQPAHFAGVPGILRNMVDDGNAARNIDWSANLGDMGVRKYGAAEEPITFKDGIGPFAEDIGIMVQERRDGTYRAWSHYSREDQAAAGLGVQFPLMRSQAIAPGTYEQANETPPRLVRYRLWNTDGQNVTREVELAHQTGQFREVEEIDWSAWEGRFGDSQLRREAYARARMSSDMLFTLPKITIDLLLLLRQNTGYSRTIARQALLLEAGEPVYLSGDWPPRIRGVHFAEGITETITPHSWVIELSLVPYPAVVGSTLPAVPPFGWDSGIWPWDDEPRPWAEASPTPPPTPVLSWHESVLQWDQNRIITEWRQR